MSRQKPIELRIASLFARGERPKFYGYRMLVPRREAITNAVPLGRDEAALVDELVRVGPLSLLQDNKDTVTLGPTAWYHVDGDVYELPASDMITHRQRDAEEAIESTVRRQSRMWR